MSDASADCPTPMTDRSGLAGTPRRSSQLRRVSSDGVHGWLLRRRRRVQKPPPGLLRSPEFLPNMCRPQRKVNLPLHLTPFTRGYVMRLPLNHDALIVWG